MNYSTEITETQWQYIKKKLHIQERKRKNELREIWNAIFYLVKTECQWRMLPHDFPKWQLVYYYYRLMNFIQHLEIVISTIKYVARARFIRDFIHYFRIVYRCFCDMKECWDLCLYII
jgi:putative transposase